VETRVIHKTLPQKGHSSAISGGVFCWSRNLASSFLNGRADAKATQFRQPNRCRPRKRQVRGTKAKPLVTHLAGGFAMSAISRGSAHACRCVSAIIPRPAMRRLTHCFAMARAIEAIKKRQSTLRRPALLLLEPLQQNCRTGKIDPFCAAKSGADAK